MKPFCLIASTNRPTLQRTIDSAYGWEVRVRLDPDRRGAGWSRNRLFESALESGAEYVRFADDDDLVVGENQSLLLAPFDDVSVDLVAFDAVIVTKSGLSPLNRPTPDPTTLLRKSAYPWNFVARTSALSRLRGINGKIFREDVPCRLGSWFWLSALKAGLKVKVVPVVGYIHFDHDDSDRLTKHPEYARHSWDYVDAADKWLKEKAA
jgi:glycosyltransferase involved in cell wall biosynthesis